MKKILMAISLTAIAAFAWCNRTTAFKSGEYHDAQRNVKVCVYQAMGKIILMQLHLTIFAP